MPFRPGIPAEETPRDAYPIAVHCTDGRRPRWMAWLVAAAMIVVGVGITQPAGAVEGDGVTWSLGVNCAIPLESSDPLVGDSYDWPSDWVEGTQVPVCSASDGAPAEVVSTVTVQATRDQGPSMSSLGVVDSAEVTLDIEAEETAEHPAIRMTQPDKPYPSTAFGAAITIDGAVPSLDTIYPDPVDPDISNNSVLLYPWIDMDSQGVPSRNSLVVSGGEASDLLPTEIPIVWDPIEDMRENPNDNGVDLVRWGHADITLVLQRTDPTTGEALTFTVQVSVTARAFYYANSSLLTFENIPGEATETISVTEGQEVSLDSSRVPVRAGYSFQGWSTMPDGEGVQYQVGDTYTVRSSGTSVEGVVLYGIWHEDGVTVVNRYYQSWSAEYTPDGPEWHKADSTTGQAGQVIALPQLYYGVTLNAFHHQPDYWSTNPDGSGTRYPSGLSGEIGSLELSPGATDLYLQWNFYMPFHANGTVVPSLSETQTLYFDWLKTNNGTDWTVLLPTDPVFTRSGYLFTGWNTLPDGSGISFAAGDQFSKNIFWGASYVHDYGLWAQWSELFDVTYEFVDADGNRVPAKVQELIPAGSEVVDGTTVTPTAPGMTDVAVDGGHWVFRGWDSGEVEIHEDYKFLGTWEFVAAPVTEPGETPEPTQPADVTPGTPAADATATGSAPSVSTGGSTGQDAGLAGGAAFLIAGLAGLGWWRRRRVTV